MSIEFSTKIYIPTEKVIFNLRSVMEHNSRLIKKMFDQNFTSIKYGIEKTEIFDFSYIS